MNLPSGSRSDSHVLGGRADAKRKWESHVDDNEARRLARCSVRERCARVDDTCEGEGQEVTQQVLSRPRDVSCGSRASWHGASSGCLPASFVELFAAVADWEEESLDSLLQEVETLESLLAEAAERQALFVEADAHQKWAYVAEWGAEWGNAVIGWEVQALQALLTEVALVDREAEALDSLLVKAADGVKNLYRLRDHNIGGAEALS